MLKCQEKREKNVWISNKSPINIRKNYYFSILVFEYDWLFIKSDWYLLYMKVIEIEGGHELTGQIRISGAKNATVALIPAAILTDEEATICNVPEITDTDALCDILKELKNSDINKYYFK